MTRTIYLATSASKWHHLAFHWIASNRNKNSYIFPEFSLSGESILSTAYGLEIKSKTDKYIALAKAGVDPCVPALIPGTFLVDVIPALKYVPDWLPGASFKRMAKKWRRLALAMRDIPYENAKQEIVW